MRILSEFIQEDTKILTIQIGKNEEVTVKRKKRSNNANSYFWELLTQLCEEMNLNVIEEYKKRIKELGICRQWELEKENVSTFVRMWEDKGIAWFTEIVEEIGDKVILNAYYGSSSYNSKQMSRLLDNLVQDCKSVGIQTLDSLEIENLRSEYDKCRIES